MYFGSHCWFVLKMSWNLLHWCSWCYYWLSRLFSQNVWIVKVGCPCFLSLKLEKFISLHDDYRLGTLFLMASSQSSLYDYLWISCYISHCLLTKSWIIVWFYVYPSLSLTFLLVTRIDFLCSFSSLASKCQQSTLVISIWE